ncbi:hypothetical protein GCM10011608_10190 [Micromonospora sonchi]|uniref:Uncharacterized protein n=1 Tax=Micromonospora sonchi TaxID=1763543 RepID=A0A917WTI6_9ACTN|nr:hypothetical protein [Micromonospora sonchi]GGM27402.1 hypothetical protein GCM10011608_10190 [Micromonospora sonchi]
MYGIPTLPVDKTTGQIIPGRPPIVGYIGKSVQTVWERQEQHRADQPFSDTICGGSWVIEEGYWTADELAGREEWWIRNGVALVPGQKPQRPVYNYDFNLDNPDRIEVWRAKEHRQAREPGWQPQNPRVPRQRGPRPGGRPARRTRRRAPVWLSRWWRRHRARVIGWTAVWALIVGGVWWLGSGYWASWEEPRNAAVLGSLGWLLAWWPNRKRRRRRR